MLNSTCLSGNLEGRTRPLTRTFICCTHDQAFQDKIGHHTIQAAWYQLQPRQKLPVTDTVPVADLVRKALQALYGRVHQGGSSPAFSGKTPQGAPLHGHQHAHLLPLDRDKDGWLDELAIVAPGGMQPGEVATLASLVQLQSTRSQLRATLILNGLGPSSEFAFLAGPSRIWSSSTPFLPPRHPHKSGRDSLPEQLLTELARRGLPSPCRIEKLPHRPCRKKNMPWRVFRTRRGRHRPPVPAGMGFRLLFDTPVQGPITLGFGSHYGLGLFLPTTF